MGNLYGAPYWNEASYRSWVKNKKNQEQIIPVYAENNLLLPKFTDDIYQTTLQNFSRILNSNIRLLEAKTPDKNIVKQLNDILNGKAETIYSLLYNLYSDNIAAAQDLVNKNKGKKKENKKKGEKIVIDTSAVDDAMKNIISKFVNGDTQLNQNNVDFIRALTQLVTNRGSDDVSKLSESYRILNNVDKSLAGRLYELAVSAASEIQSTEDEAIEESFNAYMKNIFTDKNYQLSSKLPGTAGDKTDIIITIDGIEYTISLKNYQSIFKTMSNLEPNSTKLDVLQLIGLHSGESIYSFLNTIQRIFATSSFSPFNFNIDKFNEYWVNITYFHSYKQSQYKSDFISDNVSKLREQTIEYLSQICSCIGILYFSTGIQSLKQKEQSKETDFDTSLNQTNSAIFFAVRGIGVIPVVDLLKKIQCQLDKANKLISLELHNPNAVGALTKVDNIYRKSYKDSKFNSLTDRFDAYSKSVETNIKLKTSVKTLQDIIPLK